jgi:hypothetical protein
LTKDPPPAAAFMAPATRPATNRRMNSAMNNRLEHFSVFVQRSLEDGSERSHDPLATN